MIHNLGNGLFYCRARQESPAWWQVQKQHRNCTVNIVMYFRHCMLHGHIVLTGQRSKTIPDTAQACGIWTTGIIQKELERLQEQQIIVPLGVDETAKCYSSFVIVPKSNSPIVSVVLAPDNWNYCSGEQAQQPNIHKIVQSSLHTWTMYIN